MLIDSFPGRLEEDVKAVLRILPQPDNRSLGLVSKHSHLVSIDDETLRIPARIYCEQTIVYGLTDTQKIILDCIYTRHHNGYIRQERLMRLIDNNEDWVIPFKIQLLGEYVIEIIEVLNKSIGKKNKYTYQKFIAENREYWQKTIDRIVSYWNAYYKWKFPERSNYPGFQILEKLIE